MAAECFKDKPSTKRYLGVEKDSSSVPVTNTRKISDAIGDECRVKFTSAAAEDSSAGHAAYSDGFVDAGDATIINHNSSTTSSTGGRGDAIVQPDASDIIHPHPPKSEHGDILSSFMFIPFDYVSMLSFHHSKERLDTNGRQNYQHFQVMPQKTYNISSKQTRTDGISTEINNFLKTNVETISGSIGISSVNKSTLDDSQSNAPTNRNRPPQTVSTIPTTITNTQAVESGHFNHQSYSPSHFLLSNDLSAFNINASAILFRQQQTMLEGVQSVRDVSPRVPVHSQMSKDHLQEQLILNRQYQQNQPYQLYHQRLLAAQHVNMMKYHGSYNFPPSSHFHTHQYYFNNYQFHSQPSASCQNGMRSSPKKQKSSNYPLSSQQQTLLSQSQPPMKSVGVSEKFALTKHCLDSLKKYPMAFSFYLNDNGTSKSVAQLSSDKWTKDGEKASKKKTTTKRIPNKSSVSTASLGSVRTPAKLISTEPLGSDLPTGWVKKCFERSSGNSKGHIDRYFYSPQNQIKFRSMKNVQTFVHILKEPCINGDETAALIVFKTRGHRF